MKLYGSLSRLVAILFRKDSQDITFRPNQSTTYTAARDMQLPPGDTAHVLVSASSTQTLTNKSIDADTNTITNIDNNDIKAAAAIALNKLAAVTANRALASDSSGFIVASSVTDTELGYVSGVTSSIQGQLNSDKWKQPARTASTANIDLASLPAAIDGVTMATGERFLAKEQTTGTQNGIYVYSTAGGSATRSVDADASAEFPGLYIHINEGTANADTLWLCTNNQNFVLGTDTPSFSRRYFATANMVEGPASATDEALARFDGTTGKLIQNSSVTLSDAGVLSGATQLNVDNLRLDGNTLSSTDTNGNVVLDPDGTGIISALASVQVVGSLRSDTSLILEETGAGTDTITLQAPASIAASYTLTLPIDDGASGEVLSTDGSGVLSWISNAAISSFSADWVTGDGTTKAVTHSLGSKDVHVEVYDKTDDSTILVDSVIRTSTNVVTLTSSEAPGASGWRVVIIKA